MQEAVPVGTGAMAAILGLDAAAVRDGCAQAERESGETVQAAKYNDPKQTVIAGTRDGVAKACEILKANGAKRAIPLAVSAPFHSALMKPAAERLRERLATTPIDAPFIPVIDNVDVKSESEPAAIRDALYRQAFGAVRWAETIEAIRARGIDHVFECGPGRVLAGMVKRIDADAVAAAVYDPDSLAGTAALVR
jgi:[acyl-carrier-protein] S-malonyltransferase